MPIKNISQKQVLFNLMDEYSDLNLSEIINIVYSFKFWRLESLHLRSIDLKYCEDMLFKMTPSTPVVNLTNGVHSFILNKDRIAVAKENNLNSITVYICHN